nr:DNA polymerase IV [Pantoea sp. ME81]
MHTCTCYVTSSYRTYTQQIQELLFLYFFYFFCSHQDLHQDVHSFPTRRSPDRAIRADILRETGLTASAGIAPIKFLAKIASDLNKPNGQYVITPQVMPDFLLTLPLSKIPGVGKVATKKLEEMGLRTCADVQRADLALLLKRFGKFGRVLWERSNGIDERDVVVERERKSLGVERTLMEDIHNWEQCLAIIDYLYAELDRRLTNIRPDKQIARQGVKLKFNDFQQTTQEHVWPVLNKDDMIAVARQAWDERRAGRGVRLVGLHVTLVDPQLERQLVLGW